VNSSSRKEKEGKEKGERRKEGKRINDGWIDGR
jgi:hypothetical protein